MANHSSAKKALRQTVKKTLANKSKLSEIKTYIKKTIGAINSGSKQEAEAAFIVAQSKIMKGMQKKLLKPNNAARKVGNLSKKLNGMNDINS